MRKATLSLFCGLVVLSLALRLAPVMSSSALFTDAGPVDGNTFGAASDFSGASMGGDVHAFALSAADSPAAPNPVAAPMTMLALAH